MAVTPENWRTTLGFAALAKLTTETVLARLRRRLVPADDQGGIAGYRTHGLGAGHAGDLQHFGDGGMGGVGHID